MQLLDGAARRRPAFRWRRRENVSASRDDELLLGFRLRHGNIHPRRSPGTDQFFAGRSPVHAAMRRLADVSEMQITFAIAGMMAANAHGYACTTAVVDILIRREDLDRFKAEHLGRGWVNKFEGSKNFRDVVTGVNIDALIVGQYPGDGLPKPVAFPPSEDVAEMHADGIPFVSLKTLLELKLACGMTTDHRPRDFDDVIQLIHANQLPLDYADSLQSVRRRQVPANCRPARSATKAKVQFASRRISPRSRSVSDRNLTVSAHHSASQPRHPADRPLRPSLPAVRPECRCRCSPTGTRCPPIESGLHSPGWTLPEPMPRQTANVDPCLALKRHDLVRNRIHPVGRFRPFGDSTSALWGPSSLSFRRLARRTARAPSTTAYIVSPADSAQAW